MSNKGTGAEGNSACITKIQDAQLRPEVPFIEPGNTLRVQVRVTDSGRTRLQAFEGVVIAVRKRGLNSSFTLRRVAHGVGVERVFQTHSPMLADIKLLRRGRVRRAKLYYQRQRSGRAARIKEKIERS